MLIILLGLGLMSKLEILPFWKRKLIAFTFNHRSLYRLFIRYKNLDSVFCFRKYNFQNKDIVVCGIQRSGSTLLFNIIQEVLKENNRTIDPYFEEERKYKEILHNEISTLVKKNHTYLPLVAKRIKKKKSIGFFTHRDIRDIIISHIQLGWIDEIEHWIANYKIKNMMNNALLYASTPNMHIISYEKLVHARPEVIEEVSNILGATLTLEAKGRILENTSLHEMRKKAAKSVDYNGKNHNNQLMENHIADGKTGKWKEWLSKDKIFRLSEYCREYLEYFGYEIYNQEDGL